MDKTEAPLFNKDNVQIADYVDDWKKAVKLASIPLMKNGNITNKYVDNIIQSVKDNGPYMVLTDYFALMHARPGVGVDKIGMSLLIVKHPVDMEGKPIKIFLVMAAIDNKSHLESLQKIMNVFMDEKSYQTVLSGNKEKILKLFMKG